MLEIPSSGVHVSQSVNLLSRRPLADLGTGMLEKPEVRDFTWS